jgi:hypothetical protein
MLGAVFGSQSVASRQGRQKADGRTQQGEAVRCGGPVCSLSVLTALRESPSKRFQATDSRPQQPIAGI